MAMGMLRSSPAHLVYKFGCATQHLIELIPLIDNKNLSGKQKERLRARVEELSKALWPSEGEDENNEQMQEKISERMNSASNFSGVGTQESETEVATLKARVTSLEHELSQREERGVLIGSIHIHHREPATARSYKNLFGRYFRGVDSIEICEPYLENRHQISNLHDFLEMAIEASDGLLSKALIITQDSQRTQREGLESLATRAAAMGRQLEIRYEPRLHHRMISLSTGIVIMSDRGLDLYEAPPHGLRRQPGGRAARACRGGVIEIFSRAPEAKAPDNGPRTPQERKMPSSRSGKRVIATPRLGRGTPPGPSAPMRQPLFDDSKAEDSGDDNMSQKVEKQAALVLAFTAGRAEAQKQFLLKNACIGMTRATLQRLRFAFDALKSETVKQRKELGRQLEQTKEELREATEFSSILDQENEQLQAQIEELTRKLAELTNQQAEDYTSESSREDDEQDSE